LDRKGAPPRGFKKAPRKSNRVTRKVPGGAKQNTSAGTQKRESLKKKRDRTKHVQKHRTKGGSFTPWVNVTGRKVKKCSRNNKNAGS